MVANLFDSAGRFVALRSGNYLFNSHQKWIGWFPWSNDNAVDVKGNYLGTVVKDRLLHLPARQGITTPAYAGYHGYPGYIGVAPQRRPFVDEVTAQIQELRAGGVAEHVIRELYPEGALRYVDVAKTRLNGQGAARARKSLGDWLGL